MVNSMREKNAFIVDDIVILTPFGQQKALINTILSNMAEKLNLSRDAFPKVETVDNFQSKEAKMVIFDTVVTSTLGRVDDERFMNTACTRAMMVFIIIGSEQTRALSKDSKTGDKPNESVKSANRRYIIMDGER